MELNTKPSPKHVATNANWLNFLNSKQDSQIQSECKDPKIDLKDAPVHEKAKDILTKLSQEGYEQIQLDKLTLEDAQSGVISISDFIDQKTPQIEPLAQNIQNCIETNKPKIVAFGEIHVQAPDLLSLKVATEMAKKGEKIQFLLELPANLESLVKQFLKKEITENEYEKQLYFSLTNGQELTDANEFFTRMFLDNARNILEPFTQQLEHFGIPYAFIDDNAEFNIVGDNYVKTPMQTYRDKRMSERSSQAIDAFEGTSFMKIGISHAHEVPNPNLGDQSKHGIVPNYTCTSLLADKYGTENVMSMGFFTPNTEVSGFKYTDFDRVFMWNEHVTTSQMKVYENLEKLGVEIRNENYFEDKEFLKNLYVAPKGH